VECVSLDHVVSRRPSGERSILFEMIGGRAIETTFRDNAPARNVPARAGLGRN